jgi:DNA-binding CsgD family transcriptional regulator
MKCWDHHGTSGGSPCLTNAIRNVADAATNGVVVEVSTAIASGPVSPSLRRPFSVREREVVALAVTGHENKDIAYRLGLAYSTIRVLMARAASKIGAKSRQELIEKLSAIPVQVHVQEGTTT